MFPSDSIKFLKIGLIFIAGLLSITSYGQVVDFTTTSQSDVEAVGTFTVTVQFDAAAAVDVTVPFTLTGTAIEGATDDYTITTTPLNIIAGATSGDITVTVIDDTDTEADETVIITLGVPSSGSLGTNTIHTITIEDNDTPPEVTILGPADASSFGEGVSIDFSGTATDDEDGDLTDQITWTSSIDGDFGVGALVTISTLSVGTHIIDAAVTDASLITVTSSITVTITNDAPTASTVAITGTIEVGQILTGSYVYADADGDLEGTSTFRWLRDDVAIVGATGTTYTLLIDDQDAIITFEVTPVALTGVVTGTAVVSSGVGPIVAANTAPTASTVAITGTIEVGQILTGSYVYADADGDLEGTSTFRWLRDDVAIVGATGTTYTLLIDDQDAIITFEVTPVALTGVLTGIAVVSPGVGPILAANTAPTASTVAITGTIEVGQILTGSYVYADADGDLEGTSTFRWLRDDVAIGGATALNYTLASIDNGTNIIFEVTPVALTGVVTGLAIQSPAVGPVLPANTGPLVTNVSISGTTEVGQVLTGSYTYADLDGDLEGTSTFRWLRDGVAIAGATTVTYTLIIDDEATVITFEVTPVALTGVLIGTVVESPGVGPIGAANTIPSATAVTIGGTLEVGQTLTGNYTYDDSEGDLEGVTTFRWLRDGAEIAGATFQTYTLTVSDEGTNIIFEVTPVAQTGVLVGTAVLSTSVGPILPANTAPTANTINISGIPEVGQLLTGSYVYADADGDLEGLSTFRWLRDGAAIVGATSITYTQIVDDEGALMVFEVTPVATTGVLVGTAVQSTSIGPVLPANTAPIATGLLISGTTEVGQVLTGSYSYDDADGDLEGVSTFRWLRDGVAIAGAISATYTLMIADQNAIVTFEVTPVAVSGVLNGTAVESSGVGPIGAANSVPNATAVIIDGIPEDGQLLTGSYTFTDPDGDLEGTTTFRWLRDGAAIVGATNQTYLLLLADVGTNVAFEVTPVALTGATTGSPVQSAEVGPILLSNDPPVATDLSISGSPEVGEVLTGNYTYSDVDGDLEGASTFRWLRDGIPIGSATAQTYTLQLEDEASNISFEVLPVALSGDSPGSPSQSSAVGPVLPANTPPVANSVEITGTTEVGFTLTGSYVYSDSDGDLEGTTTFRWLREGASITGATGLTYTLQSADQGTTIVLEVTPIAISGVSPGNPALSAAIGPIGAANTIPSATDVSISGSPEVGQVLTGIYTFNDADSDPEGVSTYRWLRDNTAIPGETALTYTISVLDLGATLIFEVVPIATSGASMGSAVQSAPIGPVVAANSVPIATSISVAGTSEVGQQLNGIYTYVDADMDPEGNSTYRWLRDGVAIVGATDQSYRLTVDDLGTSIIFEVTPAALTGVSPGRPVQSASIGPIRDPDIEPISITASALPRLHIANSGSVTYSVEIGGDLAVERVLFIFKSLTAPKDGWVTRDLTSTSNNFAITVTEEVFDEMGFEYEFIANDAAGNSANLLGVTYIQYPDTGLDFESLVFGEDVNSYNLVSVPLDLDQSSIVNTFEDDLGSYDQTNWRLFSHSGTGVIEYQSGLTNINRGQGYWLIVKDPTDVDTGTGTTELLNDADYEYSLVPGWNLIGNPYTFNLSWTDVLGSNPIIEGVDNQLTTYERGYRESDVLNTLGGAFVFSEQLATLVVPLEKDPAIQGGRTHAVNGPSTMEDGEWVVSFELRADSFSNNLGGFGMRYAAQNSKDIFDRIRPPRFIKYLDLSFKHSEYFAPNFSRDIVPVVGNQTWDFTVDSNIDHPTIDLNWGGVMDIPLNQEMWLYHKDLERVIDMRSVTGYSFDNSGVNTFQVIYGSPSYLEEQLIPLNVSLSAVYPNPFFDILQVEYSVPDLEASKDVNLAVYDLRGRRIKVLVQGRQNAGFYKVQWDGTNSSGNAVSNGVYLLRMEVFGQKSIYQRVVKQ